MTSSIPAERISVRSSLIDRVSLQVRLALGRRRYGSFECITRVTRELALKRLHSSVTKPTEALNLEFIAANTTIPVPRVHRVFKSHEGRLYILMDYVEGTELEKVWRSLIHQDRLIIVHQLRGYIDQLRALIPPHPGAVEAVDGTSCYDFRITEDGIGPFDSIAEFHTILGHDYVVSTQLDLESNKADKAAFLQFTSRPYRTMFAHCDIAPRNILVKGNQIVAIVDWEMAGWYPEYWEYTSAAMSNVFSFPEFWEFFKEEGFSQKYEEERHMDLIAANVITRF